MSDTVQETDKALFDRIAKTYARKDIIPSSRDARRYLLECGVNALLQEKKIDTLTEIACGVGASAEYLKGRYARYFGVDYSQELILNAREFHQSNADVKFVVKNVKELDSTDVPPADVVLAVGALHHFTEIDLALDAVVRITKNGGYFVAVEPQSGNPIVQLLRRVRTVIDADYSAEQRFFTEIELRKLFERHGLTNIEVVYQGYFSPPFAQVPLFPQWIFSPLSRCAIHADRLCDKYLPRLLKKLSWNIVVRGRINK